MGEKIQKQPDGLLAFLRVYSTGKQPDQLDESVRPVIDLTEFYASRRLETVTDSTTSVATGDDMLISVPAGESWRLHNLSAKIDSLSSGGDVWSFSCIYRPAGVGQTVWVAKSPIITATQAAETMRAGYQFTNPPILVAGSVLGATVDLHSGVDTARLLVSACIERLTN